MTVYWRVLPEEYYRNSYDVQRHLYREEMLELEVSWMIDQIQNLPTRTLLKLYDSVMESMEETEDPDVQLVLEKILQYLRQEIEHREQSEGQISTTWMF